MESQRAKHRSSCAIMSCFVRAAGVVAILLGAPAPSLSIEIFIDHESGEIGPFNPAVLKAGEELRIVVKNTNPDCFTYQYKALEFGGNKSGARGSEHEHVNFQLLRTIYSGDDTDYFIKIAKRDIASCEDEVLQDRGEDNPFVVSVRSYKWALGFSGGFTVDNLTNPKFSLSPSSQDIGGTSTQGYTVVREESKEDAYVLGGAAMIHVYNENPNRKASWWVPLSFGLGLNGGSDLRYFIGTSVKLGKEFYLTGGLVFGSEASLPSGLNTEDDTFTTDANALQTLGKRTDSGVFLALTYSFLGKKEPFENALKTTPPVNLGSSLLPPSK